MLDLLLALGDLNRPRGLACLSTCLMPCPWLGPGVSEGVRGAGWGGGEPRSSPTLHMTTHIHSCTQTHFPCLPFSLSLLPVAFLPFCLSLPTLLFISSFICLLISCPLFPLLFLLSPPPFLPPDVYSPSHGASLYSAPLHPQLTSLHTYFIFYTVFLLPFLGLDMCRYTNTLYYNYLQYSVQ